MFTRGPSLGGEASVAASARGLIDFLMIGGQAPGSCWYQGFGLAAAASLWPPSCTTIDSPPAPSLFGLLAMCRNPLAQSSATIERDRSVSNWSYCGVYTHTRTLARAHTLVNIRPE